MTRRTTPPPLSSFQDLSLQFPGTITLDNGIECYVVNGGDDEMNRVAIYLNGGTMMESKPAQAILTAMILTTGSQSMTPQQVAELFDYYGARKSSDSYDYWSEVSLTSLNDNFSHTMCALCDCIMNPSFAQEELDVFKRRIAGNLSIAMQRVKYKANVCMKQLYYGKCNPLGQAITPEDIMAISREDLIEFHRNYYSADRCKVIIAGKVTDEVIATLNNTLGKWDVKLSNVNVRPWHTEPSQQMLTIVNHPGAMQSAVHMRIATIKRDHPDYLPLRVLVTLLGGYFGSRLMMNIREDKGYTYGIHAALMGIQHDGTIDIQCECATEHTWNVVKEVRHEMKRLREELVPDQELETVKQHMLSSLAKVHDTPYNIATYVSSTLLFGVYPEYHNEQLECIDTITAERLRDLAVKYLQDDMLRIVIAGDRSALNSTENHM